MKKLLFIIGLLFVTFTLKAQINKSIYNYKEKPRPLLSDTINQDLISKNDTSCSTYQYALSIDSLSNNDYIFFTLYFSKTRQLIVNKIVILRLNDDNKRQFYFNELCGDYKSTDWILIVRNRYWGVIKYENFRKYRYSECP